MVSDISPLVSVVVPCYNHENYVQDCIKSIIDQDYENIELIIIDDGSSDGSVDKIKELIPECEKRFTRFEFRTRPNKGLCATLNEAISWCQGEFYSAIASDDMMLPGKTSLQVNFFKEHPECDALFGGMYFVDHNGEVLRKRKGVNGTISFEDILLMKASLGAPTQMLRLNKLKAAGPYPEGQYIEDWYMWLVMSHGGNVICSMEQPLVYYRRHESNISSKVDSMNSARMAIINNFRDHPLYPKAKAACFLSAAIDFQISDWKRSWSFFVKAISDYPTIIAHKRSLKYFIKFIYNPNNKSR